MPGLGGGGRGAGANLGNAWNLLTPVSEDLSYLSNSQLAILATSSNSKKRNTSPAPQFHLFSTHSHCCFAEAPMVLYAAGRLSQASFRRFMVSRILFQPARAFSSFANVLDPSNDHRELLYLLWLITDDGQNTLAERTFGEPMISRKEQ